MASKVKTPPSFDEREVRRLTERGARLVIAGSLEGLMERLDENAISLRELSLALADLQELVRRTAAGRA